MRFVLWVYKEGYNPAQAEIESSSESPYVRIAMEKIETAVLTGIVTDAAGQAVAGAEVLVYPEFCGTVAELGDATAGEANGEVPPSDSLGGGQGVDPGIGTESPRGPFQEYTATTNEEGGFVIDGLPIGCTVNVSARKRGYEVAHRRVEIAEKQVLVRLYMVALEEGFANRASTIREGVRYEMATDRVAYNADETAQLRYRVMNLTEEVKTFSFATTQRSDFLVLSAMFSEDKAALYNETGEWEWAGEPIWRWSYGREFEQSPGSIVLAQGESVVFEAALDLGELGSEEHGFFVLGFLAGLRADTQTYVKFEVERAGPIAQVVSIAGKVVDAEGHPLPETNVTARPVDVALRTENLDETRQVVVTDQRGDFVFRDLYRGGTYEVTAHRKGYTAQQKIITAIREENTVRFVLRKEGTDNQYANVSVFVHEGVQIELFTDRHFYEGADDVIRMGYRITNAREEAIAFAFTDGQQVDFVLRKNEHVIWRWSAGRGFTDAPTTLEIPAGGSKTFKTEVALVDLEALEVANGNLLLSGYLALPEHAEKTRNSLELTIGQAFRVIYVGAEDGGPGPILLDSGTGASLELLAPAGTKGQIEFAETARNTLGELAGYHFLRMVDFRPDQVLLAFVEQIYVEIQYSEAQLNALGIVDEGAVHLFIWDVSGDTPAWRRMEGGVDAERNVAWGNVPATGTQWALFAAKPLAVEEPGDTTPTAFSLLQNVPNPFNPATTIRFSIPDNGNAPVTLIIYTAQGQQVRALVDGAMTPGAHTVVWNGLDDAGRAVSSGVYVYRLRAGENNQARKMLLIR
ncbi:MAG: BsuPI-related putative proteinase inhibitor, partial [Candidatus Latescibacterota bacterium]